jgi:hypothetical protein
MASADVPADSMKFRCRSDKNHGKVEGKVYLRNRHVVFTSNDELFSFKINFEWIQGLKKAAAPILLQLTLHPGKYCGPKGPQDSVIFDFTERANPENRLAFSLGNPAAASMSASGGSDFPKATVGEKDRDKLLGMLKKEIEPLLFKQANEEPTPQERMLRDPVLKETYEALVISGIMGEQEFWRHRHQAKLQEDTNLQKRGVPSAKTDIKELTSDQQFIRYSVTKADEEQYFQQHPTLRQIYDKEVGTGGMTRQQFWTAFLEFSVTSSKQHDNLKFNDATKYNKFDNFEEKDKEEAKRRFKEACTENADTFAVSSDALDIYHGIYENRCSQGAYDLTFAMLFMFHLLQYHKPKF